MPYSTHLTGFTACSETKDVKIKEKIYKVIASRYDGYGQFTYVYLDQPNGELKVVTWQDDHESCQPLHFALSSHHIS